MDPLLGLPATELRDRMAAGALRVSELAEACLERVARREDEIQAFEWLDREHVMQQAAALDAHRATGRPVGPLHGLPVAIKDIIDTAGIPTGNGTPLDTGRVPSADAFVVARLRQAGALIFGKTVTAELAYLHPGKTRNPHDAARTPGGSSSGSAAAVAAGMVPLAVGTQTAGSVIRPASFCGIVGFKPSFGLIPRTGVLEQSVSLDTVGVFGQTVSDAAMIAEVLAGYDPDDSATRMLPVPGLFEMAESEPPLTPTLAIARQAAWDEADPDMLHAFAELADALGDACDEIELPPPFDEAIRSRAVVNLAEMAKSYHAYEERGRDRLSPEMLEALDKGKEIRARDYLSALDWRQVLNDGLEAVFARYDAILTPAAPGPAPQGLHATGNSGFNAVWTFCGTPAVTLPVLESGEGMPMGVQLVGPRGNDGRLLRTANWLVRRLAGAA